MISFKHKGLTPQQEALTWESASGWPGHSSARSRDRPLDPSAALKISAFYRAVDLRSDSIGRLPIKVWDQGTRLVQTDHYLNALLQVRPNEAMTPFTYKKLVEYQRLVLGNAYVWIYRDRNGRPAELLPLPPGTCHTYLQPGNGKLWYLATDPKTKEPYFLDSADILHFKGFTTNGIEGISLLTWASRSLRVAQSRDQYEEELYQNGSTPSGVLTTNADLSGKKSITLPDGTQGSYQDMVRYEWERTHSGAGKRFRVAVLDNSLEFKPITMSNADAQFVEGKGVSVADIARFAGVPLYLLYAGKESYQSNSQNGVEYVKYTLQPSVTQYEEEYSKKLLTLSARAAGLWVQINMMAELRGDYASRGTWYQTLSDLGVFSVNDVRALEDLPAVPGGDARRASLNYVPLEKWDELSLRRAGGSEPPTGEENENG